MTAGPPLMGEYEGRPRWHGRPPQETRAAGLLRGCEACGDL